MERFPRQQENNQRSSVLTELSSKLRIRKSTVGDSDRGSGPTEREQTERIKRKEQMAMEFELEKLRIRLYVETTIRLAVPTKTQTAKYVS
ncbi:hypothetical protein LAZ67_2006817 [Cordylochernes scorpioides]|uniref:Uncharacterized protein n=1 Tax=Cordylochernes scorpioides TaxID=51811 RepID=A0ABY6K5Q8_9ARAC|nr:hypothetical protein LAZ67_2006817 [Cordylochernes scorpioides]